MGGTLGVERYSPTNDELRLEVQSAQLRVVFDAGCDANILPVRAQQSRPIFNQLRGNDVGHFRFGNRSLAAAWKLGIAATVVQPHPPTVRRIPGGLSFVKQGITRFISGRQGYELAGHFTQGDGYLQRASRHSGRWAVHCCGRDRALGSYRTSCATNRAGLREVRSIVSGFDDGPARGGTPCPPELRLPMGRGHRLHFLIGGSCHRFAFAANRLTVISGANASLFGIFNTP